MKVLYVSFDHSNLLARERLLLGLGCEVSTVLGLDGVVAQGPTGTYVLSVIDDCAPLEERMEVIEWIKNNLLSTYVLALSRPGEEIPSADHVASSETPELWLHCLTHGADRREDSA